jgi:PAS domain S-box-containing protein
MTLDTARTKVLSGALFAAAGGVVIAFCAKVIADWHDGGAPGGLPTGLERVQYDTAWAFAFAGAGLISFALRLGSLARLFAAVPILLGSLRLIAYAIPGVIPIRPMLAVPWLPFGAGSYNDMSVLTALMLITLGCALATVRPSARRPARSVIASLISTIALALALLLLFGAWTGGAAAMRWLLLTGGDRTNALLAIIIAGAILADAWLGSTEERHAIRRWAPLIVWFAVFVCVLVLWRALALHETDAIRDSTRFVAVTIRGEIERDLQQRIDALGRLGERARTRDPTPDSWQQDARLAIRDLERFGPVGWIDSSYIMRLIAPPDAFALAGVDVRADPVLGPAANRAATTRSVTFTRSVDFAPGRHRFMIFVPVFDGDVFRGLVAATLMDGAWLGSLVRNRFIKFHIELDEQQTRVETVAGDSASAGWAWAVEQPVPVANVTWTLRVTPTGEYLKQRGSGLADALLALGTLLATLLALCTYLFQTANARARDLAAANVRLVADIEARKRAELAQRDSEERTRLIIAAIKDHAIYMLDADGRIATWNRGATELTGYAADEVLGHDFALLYPPDGECIPAEALTVAVRDGWSADECWHLRKDGSRYRGDDMISAIRDDERVLRGFSIVTRDVTQRIELREQIERSRDFYLSLFSDIPNLVWRSTANGACDYVNKAWIEYTGRTRDAEQGGGWIEGMHPDDRASWQQTFTEALRAQQPFEIEFRLRRSNGTWGSLICSGRPYYDMNDAFCGFLCSCLDNTGRRNIEIALKESEQRYEAMTSNVPGMMFQLARKPDGTRAFTYISNDCEPLTGLAEALLRQDAEAFFALVPAANRPHLAATLDTSAAQLSTWNWSGRLQPPHEPREKWVTIRARPRQSDDGGTILWDGVVLDDTANRLIQLEIERSREEQRALSRHLQSVREEEKASIARELHDELGSLLTALKMDLDELATGRAGNAGTIRERVTTMIELLDSAVATTRRIVTDLRPSILDDLGLAAALRWQAGEYRKHSDTKIVVETPEPDIAIDRECGLALFRIFQETLTNVMRHAEATEVDVRLAEADACYVLQIHDNGIGMPDDALRKPTSHGIRGMRERARQQGGDLTVASAAGEGTTLLVTIPKPTPA